MTLPDPSLQQSAILIFTLGLIGVIGIATGLSTMWKNIETVKAARNPPRNPPSEEEAAKTYATKADLHGFRCEWQTACRANHVRVDDTFKEVFGVLRAQQDSIIARLDDVKDWQSAIERQIGKIEGKIEL
ncbi:MAG: hypothetical protein WCP22_13905 [Chlamydiota bacterium]